MSEHGEQSLVIAWANRHAEQYPVLRWLYSSLNGIFIPAPIHIRAKIINHMKAEGMKKGVADLCLPMARHGFHGLYIEMKRNDGGVLSKEQKDFLAFLEQQGYYGAVCNGYNEAVDVLEWYIKGA